MVNGLQHLILILDPAHIVLGRQHHGTVPDQLAQLGARGIVDELDFLAVFELDAFGQVEVIVLDVDVLIRIKDQVAVAVVGVVPASAWFEAVLLDACRSIIGDLSNDP